MEKCRFVVTEHADDFAYNCCHEVYDDPQMALGKVLSSILDDMDDNYDEEVRIRFEHDDANDDFYDIVCVHPESNNHLELAHIYRVFYLRDEKEKTEG